MTGRLAARRVLVVGGGQQDYGQTDPPSGIGRAISRACAHEGARVIVGDRDPEAAASTAEAITAARGEATAPMTQPILTTPHAAWTARCGRSTGSTRSC
jgi:3-oxoacyl-[acyl-carrier protein] reductase